MTKTCSIVLISLFLLSVSCGSDQLESQTYTTTGKADSLSIEGTPLALGLLNFLNSGGTTREFLDDEVGLNRISARNLTRHRNGADGLWGTEDDNLFDSVDEIDSVSWVGTRSLEKLFAYVADQGWIPDDNDVIGVYDAVEFTVLQACLVIDLVNSAGLEQLDLDVGLDQRAAENIVAARPIGSVRQLSEVSYVGESALSKLKEYACPQEIAQVGIISDLDKTVIPPSSQEFPDAPYPGVAALYSTFNAPTFYVTARIEEGIDGIPQWLEEHGLPIGPIETGISGMPWEARPEKVADISKILNQNPDLNVILFGDSSHVDPEVYNDILELYPDRILAALIHVVNNVNPDRIANLSPFENHAQAAAILYAKGLLDESSARDIMFQAQADGLEISDQEIEDLLLQ
jgi:hypothetical protein